MVNLKKFVTQFQNTWFLYFVAKPQNSYNPTQVKRVHNIQFTKILIKTRFVHEYAETSTFCCKTAFKGFMWHCR